MPPKMTLKEYGELKEKVRENALTELILSQKGLTVAQMVELLELVQKLNPDSKIEHLDLAICDLGEANVDLAEVIKKCPRLRHIDLSFNNIEEQAAQALLLAISNCRDLRFLDLRGACINDAIDKDKLAFIIAQFPNLQHLDLRRCSLGNMAVALSSAIAKCTQLRFFALNCYEKIGSGGMAALASAIAKCSQLQYLAFEGIDIDVGGAAALAAVIPQLQLQELTLGGIALSHGIFDQQNASVLTALQTLAPAIAQCSQLRLLSLRNNDINKAGVEALAPVFEKCRKIQLLDLSINNLRADGVKALMPLLEKCIDLQYLNFDSNNLDDEAVEALATAIAKCSKLQDLILSCNTIGAQGMKALATAIAQCSQLRLLYLHSNALDDEAAKTLATSIARCSQMQDLDLSNNHIGDQGMETLASKLAQCSQLKRLDLHSNHIGVTGAAAVLKACRNLVELDLSGSAFGKTALTLVPVIAQCLTLEKLHVHRNSGCSPIAARFAEVVAGLPSRRAVLTFLYAGYQRASASTGADDVAPALVPAATLVKRDGDGAIMRGVLRNLIG